MPAKITDHELQKLREKASLTRLSSFKSLNSIMSDANHLAKLVLKRHGYSHKTHMIDFQTGSILEKKLKGEDKVIDETERYL